VDTREEGGDMLRPLRRVIPSELFVSSLYLIAGPVASSLLGFLFWILAARLASASEIGVAGAAIAAVALLMAVADFGLSTAIIHYSSGDPGHTRDYVNTSIRVGWISMVGVAGVFLIGLPIWAPGLLPVREDMAFAGLFVGYAALNHVLALQDATMVAIGRAKYVFWRILACNVPSVLLVVPAILIVGGTVGLFAAYVVPNLVIGLLMGALVLPRMVNGYRFGGVLRRETVSRMAGYGLANHVGNILWGVPAYVLPLIAINVSGAEPTGRFYIAWAIAGLVLSVPRMVTYALFAQASRPLADLRSLSLHALLAIALVGGPAVALLWLRGDLILGLFGLEYVNEGLLRTLLASAVPFSVSSIWFVWLRAQRRLGSIILFAAFAAASVVGSAAVLAPSMGIDGIAAGWSIGHSITGVVALVALLNAFGTARPAASS
jgi:O-antigen/teichoic acid export membrane protein